MNRTPLPSSKMHDDEVTADASLVRELLEAQFPQWADLPIDRFPSGGTVNAIYRVGSEFAVRLPLNLTGVGHLERERSWLRFLGPQLPLATPESVGEGAPTADYPFPWSVHRWLEGEPWCLDTAPDSTASAQDLARFISAFRAIDLGGGPAGRPADRGRRLADRDGIVQAALAQLTEEIDTTAAAEVWQASAKAPVWEGPPTWFHGDLLPGNVLLADGRLHAVIDFGGVGVGDPACDAAPAWTMFTGASRSAFRAGLDPDDASWQRGRGWALSIALLALPYYRDTNASMAAMARRTIAEALSDQS